MWIQPSMDAPLCDIIKTVKNVFIVKAVGNRIVFQKDAYLVFQMQPQLYHHPCIYLAFSLGTGIKSAYFKIKTVMCLNHISFSHFSSPFQVLLSSWVICSSLTSHSLVSPSPDKISEAVPFATELLVASSHIRPNSRLYAWLMKSSTL